MDKGFMIVAAIFSAFALFGLFVSVGIPLILKFTLQPKNPVISVESSAVKAYNLTVDFHLFCIVNLGVRVLNPNPKKHSFGFNGVEMEVRKGRHHTLANDALRDFRLGPNDETAVEVEAVGLRVEVERKIAAELAADLVVGEGRVNAFMSGQVGSKVLKVVCKNVAVDFSWSTVRLQNVRCKVKVTNKP